MEPPKKKYRYNNNANEQISNKDNKTDEDNIFLLETTKESIQQTSPKKRLDISLPSCSQSSPKKQIFRYGNYNRYYSYRNPKDFQDMRLDIFREHKDLFTDKEIFDIGCNSGLITMEISKKFQVKNIIGIDIDRSLINKVKKVIEKSRKYFTGTNRNSFPFNIKFIHGNYVLRNDVLLEIEREQFDVLLCLSVTKWIHLNFGDDGLKQAFKRMYLQLRPGGKLILEAQPWVGYKRRKKLTDEIFENFKSIQFFPKDFTAYLLGPEVGFSEVNNLGIPDNCAKGFQRQIQVFNKIIKL